MNHWSAARPRANVSKVLASIRELMKSDLPWFPIVQDELNKILYLDGNVNSQLGPRIFRSAFLKLAIVISRQCYVLLNQDLSGAMQSSFLNYARQKVSDLCDQLEGEIFELFDEIEHDLV